MKLHKFLSLSGVISRRKSIDAIKNALVTVNDYLVLNPFEEIDHNNSIIRLDNRIIKIPSTFETIILHKPKGYICSKDDELNRKTIYNLIPKSKTKLDYVGRLDKDTVGLIILTSDGQLNNFLTHPSNKIEKEYEVITNEFIPEKIVQRIKKGIFIGSGERGRARIISQKKSNNFIIVNLVLTEGKKNEIRRIFKFTDLKLISLKRVRIQNLHLGNLKEGQWKILKSSDIKNLLKA